MVKATARRFVSAVIIPLALACQPGCGLLAQMNYWTGNDLIDAEYKGLEDQRVAVICVSDRSAFAPGSESDLLARGIGNLLKENVKNIELVRPDEVADWIDKNDWDEIDYREIAKGVKAQKVVAIDMAGFRIHDGQSLYRGRCSMTVSVFDMTSDGKEVFRRTVPEIKFPANGVYHSSETSETAFRRAFIHVIAQQAARFFHKFDLTETFGRDPAQI